MQDRRPLANSDRLLEAVYGELRRIAAARLRREHRNQTLRPTELVHEAYMRLVGSGDERWNSLGHFFGAAAEAMRRVLIDRARQRHAAKRGGGAAPRPLDSSIAASADGPADQLALHEALSRLAQLDPEKAALVTLRYFAGLTEAQAGEALGISRVHEPRAGGDDRPGHRHPQRHLQPRRPALRAAHRRHPLRRQEAPQRRPRRDPAHHPRGGAPQAEHETHRREPRRRAGRRGGPAKRARAKRGRTKRARATRARRQVLHPVHHQTPTHRPAQPEPVTATPPPSAVYKFRKLYRRNRAACATVVAVAIAVLAGAGGLGAGLIRAMEAEARAETELARALEVKDIIGSMLGSVSPFVAQGKDTSLLRAILDETAARLAAGEVRDELVAAELRHITGATYSSLGLYEQAEEHLPIALAIRERRLGRAHPDTLASMCELGWLYQRQGRYDEADPLNSDAARLCERVLGKQHAETALARTTLGNLRHAQGRYEDAERLYIGAVKTYGELFGVEDSRTLAVQSNLAECYAARDMVREAESLYDKVIPAMRRVMSETHPNSLVALSGRAALYAQLDRNEDARAALNEVLALRERVHGRHAPSTLQALTSLASLEVVGASERTLGAKHRETINALRQLGHVLVRQQRLDEAGPLLEDAWAWAQIALAPDNEVAIATMTDLALHYSQLGRHEEAISLSRRALELQEKAQGPNHSDVLTSMGRLARSLQAAKRYDEAQPLYLDLIERQRKLLGERNTETLGNITNLGNIYRESGRYRDAARMYEKSLPIKREALGPNHPWTRFARGGLIVSYEAMGRLDEALDLRREQLELNIAGAAAPDASPSVLNAAAVRLLTIEPLALRDPRRAMEYAARACEHVEDENLWRHLGTLAYARHLAGDPAGAIAAQRRAMSMIPADQEEAMEAFQKQLAVFEESTGGG